MNIVIDGIQDELYNYLYILSGGGSSNYMVNPKTAHQRFDKLLQTLRNLGNNPYMAGSYICPWARLGQKVNRKKTGPKYPYLRMYDYKYSRKGVWHIVYVVDEAHNLVRFIKLYGNGYNTGKRLLYPNSEPILECLRWMVRLGCMNEEQVISASKQLLL